MIFGKFSKKWSFTWFGYLTIVVAQMGLAKDSVALDGRPGFFGIFWEGFWGVFSGWWGLLF